MRLQISVAGELIVVIPDGFDPALVPGLLHERRSWIASALKSITASVGERSVDERPSEISFPAIAETWSLKWNQVDGRPAVATERSETRLLIEGGVVTRSEWQPILRRWVMKQAKHVLKPWVDELAATHGFAAPPRLTVRCQRTRWGSYSQRGTISLNAQLLFLRAPLVRYVLLHELCHAVHFNHSHEFWSLLERCEPRMCELRRELRNGWLAVPPWLTYPLPEHP